MGDDLRAKLVDEIASALNAPSGSVGLVSIERPRSVADANETFLIHASSRRFVFQLSPERFPDVVHEDRRRSLEARAALGELGSVIDEPVAQGRIDGRSYAIAQYREPLARGRVKWLLERRKYSAPMLDLLRRIASCSEPADGAFLDALTALAEAMPQLRVDADAAVDRIAKGKFMPRHVVMHGDLWKGNILKADGSLFPFVLIDWRGSRTAGYPIFDLLRAADSLRTGGLAAELRHHAALLGCEPGDTRAYLLAALGHIALNLDQFPKERFVTMAEQMLRIHDAAR